MPDSPYERTIWHQKRNSALFPQSGNFARTRQLSSPLSFGNIPCTLAALPTVFLSIEFDH